MPGSYPEWPTGEQMQAYLCRYAEAFGLSKHIRLRTRIDRAQYDDAVGQWILTATETSGSAPPVQAGHRFDFLVVCNGIFSTPSIPEFPGAREFVNAGGRICHTSEFTHLEEARGKQVIIVGYGKSSCDVANATAEISAATHVVVRGLIWKIPKRIANTVNFKYLFLTRMGEALFRYIRKKQRCVGAPRSNRHSCPYIG